MAKYGKYRSQQELLEAKQDDISIIDALEGVVENMQKMRKQLKKPKGQRWSADTIDNELKHNLVGLNKVVKQLKRNQILN